MQQKSFFKGITGGAAHLGDTIRAPLPARPLGAQVSIFLLRHFLMHTPFNADGRYDGTYHCFDTLVVKGDTVTVHLNADELFEPSELAEMAADIARHHDLALNDVENAMMLSEVPAAVDTTRPGTIIDGQTVMVFLKESTHGGSTEKAPTGAQRGKSMAADAVQLPDTEVEYLTAATGLQDLLPNLMLPQDALRFVKAAASILVSVGCKSAAELESRGADLNDQLGLSLNAEQTKNALLYILFGRRPVDEEDRQLLIARVVRESGGPVGVDADVVPGGSGVFGRTATNPVPVAGIVSAGLYLQRLRTANGLPLTWKRTGSVNSGSGPVDCYTITDIDGEPQGKVFISPYHQRVSA